MKDRVESKHRKQEIKETQRAFGEMLVGSEVRGLRFFSTM